MKFKLLLLLSSLLLLLPSLLMACTLHEIYNPTQYASFKSSGWSGNGGICDAGKTLAGFNGSTLIGSSYSTFPIRSFSQFDIKSISTNYESYYLVFSPYSAWSFNTTYAEDGEKAIIYAYEGDGTLYSTIEYHMPELYLEYKGDINDYNYTGVNHVIANVVAPSKNDSWYTSNGIGGYLGDLYVPIDNFIDIALAEGWEQLTFKIDPFATTSGLFRSPTILALNEWPTSVNPVPTPEPSTILLLASGIIGLAGARRKLKK